MSDKSGQIQLILGPMFSGKTTELLRRIRRYTLAQRRCLVVKHEADTRYSQESAATHDRNMCPAVACGQLLSLGDRLPDDVEVIGIDEGQFFPDLVEFAERMANAGKIVIVAALDGTFQRKPFGNVGLLLPLSEQVDKLNAVCMRCHCTASFSARVSSETEVELIGGADKYLAVCRHCFLQFSQKKEIPIGGFDQSFEK